MINQIKQQTLLLGFAIASSYLLTNQPTYAVPIPQPKSESTQIAQTIIINRVQLIDNTVLTPKELAPILQPLQGKAIGSPKKERTHTELKNRCNDE